ncbi:MAG: methyl-accepting chemotaxis protein [Bacillota bacterium]
MRWTIGRKLMAHSLLLIAMVGAVAAVGGWGLNTLQWDHLEVTRLDRNMIEARRIEANLTELSLAATAYANTMDPQYPDMFRLAAQEVESALAFLDANVKDAQARTQLEDVKTGYESLKSVGERVILREEIRSEEIKWMVWGLHHPRVQAATAIESFIGTQAGLIASFGEQVERNTFLVQAAGGGVALLSIVVGLILSGLLSRAISRPITAIAAAAQRLAEGDLQVEELPVKGRDEVAEMAGAFNRMTRDLRRLLEGIAASTQAVLAASQQLANASHESAQSAQEAANAMTEVAEGTTRQAASAEEVHRSIAEMQATIQQIAAGAGRSSEETQQAAERLRRAAEALGRVAEETQSVAAEAAQTAEVAQVGAEVVDQTVHGMVRIEQVVGESEARILELEKSSAQIGEITSTIFAIAEQTNLLALNAAIEAARAGDHGRGFAVVADEVRKLAERSATSARQISGLIESIQAQVAEVVQSMAAGSDEVRRGSERAQQAGDRLTQILQTVEKAAADIRRVSETTKALREETDRVVATFENLAAVTEENTAATEEMAASTEEMTEAVATINEVAQESAAAAEEASASIEELTAGSEQVAALARDLDQIAQDLRNRVSVFRL